MHTISMDFETYGEVDITKAGSYAYINDPSFQPLLLSYSVDKGEVKTLDFTETPPDVDFWRGIIFNPDYLKIAWNVTFEREVWKIILGERSPIEQWSDTMVLARYAGLPGHLAAAGEALGLGEDKAKMKEGRMLIQYFSKPYKGKRRMPSDSPERWDLFKRYNAQDVVAESEIRDRIQQAVTFPKREQRLWEIDQTINDQGILIDLQMAHQAIKMADHQKEILMQEAIALTGLENPNSVSQLKAWLDLDEDQTLRKKDVAEMLGTVTDEKQKRVLEIRQELGKSSVKKYEAMVRSACPDGRARGTLQFYGAGRTGRWCLTGDHEVLTPDGWMRIDEWSGGRIACWNPQGSILSFQKSDQVCFDYDGPMYDYEDTRISQISTPDHKMYYKPRYTSDFIIGSVEEMAKHRPCIPLTGRRITSPTLGRDELRVLVMVQADGHYTQDGILRLRFARKRKIERCKHLLRKCEIVFTYTAYADGTATFSIPLRAQPIWLRMFRKKVFDWWMINEDPDVFFEELPLWDGCWVGPNSQQYSTTKKQNADVVQALAHLSGRTAVIVSKNHNVANWSPQYVVNIWEKPGEAHEVRAKPVISEFSGKVYCASTPTGFFLVRRNGRVWITGNSGRCLQPQNYPQNHIGDGSMEDLEMARKLVKEGDEEALEFFFGSVASTLSQLTRTALIPAPGKKFVVADFSAIEARVIAWLAGEKWRMDTFKNGGDIYCASASQMFHVPVEKHGVNGHLRQKGKVAELALGYGGSTGALISMGALDMGLTEEELPEIVAKWREASPRIVSLWYQIGNACTDVVTGRRESELLPRNMSVYMTSHRMAIRLPSKRCLYYVDPQVGVNRFGGQALTYMGVEQGKWSRLETFSGKLTENCIAEGTLVVTSHGVIPIEKVTIDMLIWDGVSWVAHEGLIDKGLQYTVETNGLRMTPEHLILTEKGWREVGKSEGLDWADVPLPDCSVSRPEQSQWRRPLGMSLRLRKADHSRCRRFAKEKTFHEILRMHESQTDQLGQHYARHVSAPSFRCMAQYETAVHRTPASCLGKLRRARHNCVRPLDKQLRKLLGRHGSYVAKGFRSGSNRQQQKLQPGELPLDYQEGKLQQPTQKHVHQHALGANDCLTSSGKIRNREYDAALQTGPRMARRIAVRETGLQERVYDIRNCGPRHRFVVCNGEECFIVHNCVQAIARDCLCTVLNRLALNGMYPVEHVHDEVIIEVPAEEADQRLQQVLEIMATPIPWAPGLLLKGAGYLGNFYFKD